jgi:hypothetical protein
MTLAEAEAHIGNPVLAREQAGYARDGQIVEVNHTRQLVKIRLRRQTHPYDHTGQHGWYAPCHLNIPRWWRDRTEGNR